MIKLNKKIIVSALVLSVFVLFGVFGWIKINTLVSGARSVIAEKDALMTAIDDRNIEGVRETLLSLRHSIQKIDRETRGLFFLRMVPGARNEIDAKDALLRDAYYLLDSADLTMKIMDEAGVDIFSERIDLTSASALQKLDRVLASNKHQLIRIAERGDEIVNGKSAVSRVLQISELQKKMGDYIKSFSQASRLVSVTEDGIAAMLGLRGEKRYLLLFQNSDELRPGGGIISTYGLVNVKDGQTSNLFVDHVQNLRELYIQPRELNPDPIKQTMRHQKDLYIYDANWLGDPDEWLEKIFRSWNAQKQPNVDGIIAVSTKMLENVMLHYEPVKVPGVSGELRASDIVASLDYYFDVENDLYDYGKYRILGPLVNELIAKIRTSDPQRLKKLLVDAKGGLLSREMFIYTKDEIINDALRKTGIQNRIPLPPGDEYYALEANLGSGKADGRMKRSLMIQIYAQENQPVAIATTTHDYSSGVDDFRAGGYFGYTRYFLPLGSKLGSFENFNLVEGDNEMEAGREVYGNYYNVATGSKKNVSITYALADKVAREIKKGRYSLMLRKQGGLEMPYEIKINIPDGWKNPKITTTGGVAEFTQEKNLVIWKGVLTKDVKIELGK